MRPTVNAPVTVTGDLVQANVAQQKKTLAKTHGYEGFRIAQQVAVDVGSGATGGLTIYVGGYSVYRQVGTTILRVQFASPTTHNPLPQTPRSSQPGVRSRGQSRSESLTESPACLSTEAKVRF